MRLILKNELKRAFKRRYVIGFILIALILQGFIQFGNFKHFDNIENRIFLQKAERAKVSHYTMFRQYATFGIIIMFVPSQFGILYNDSTFDLLVSNTNIGDMFDIYLPKKGKELFSINSPFMNFMGMSLLLFFLFGIFYGIDTTINKAYLKFLSSRSGTKKVSWFTIFFRLILLNFALLLMFLINISVLLINNINLFRSPLLLFCWAIILVTSCSFGIGCYLGTIKSNFKRNTAFFVIYVLSVILLVLFLNFITTLNAADIKPVFEFNNDNLKAVMIEEENMVKKHGVLPRGQKPTEEQTIDARQYLLNYNKKIRENLEGLKHKLESKIKTRKLISSFFPTLFYFSLTEDASTNSYDSFIDFYTYSEKRKQEFVQFSVDKIYPKPDPEKNETTTKGKQSNENSQDSQAIKEGQSSKGEQPTQPNQTTQPVRPKIENFIKDDEDLFFAKSKIPWNFWLGSIMSILWIAGFLLAAYRRTFKQIKDEPGEIRDFVVEMKSDGFNYLATGDEGLKSQVYNYLEGDGFTTVKITMDEKVLEPKDFIYAYKSGKFLKDIDLKVLYTELLGIKYKAGMGYLKAWKILVQAAEKTNSMLVLDNFFKGLKIPEVNEIIQYLKHRGVNALYIGENLYEAEKIADNLIFSEDDRSVEGIREVIDEINSHL